MVLHLRSFPFQLVFHAAPYRHDLLRAVAGDLADKDHDVKSNGVESQCLRELKSYVINFSASVAFVVRLYEQKGLEKALAVSSK